MMLTKLGIFLRKLRLDHKEILKDMAEKLNVSVSFLSAVENGKKKMPQNWIEIIEDKYNLSSQQRLNLDKAIAETQEFVEINLKKLKTSHKEFAISLARKLENIDEEEIKKWMKIINKEEI